MYISSQAQSLVASHSALQPAMASVITKQTDLQPLIPKLCKARARHLCT